MICPCQETFLPLQCQIRRKTNRKIVRMSINARACWDSCLKLIEENVTEQQYNTWFRPLVFESYKPAMKTLLVQVPSPFVYEYLEEHYVDLLKKVLTRTLVRVQNSRIVW